MSGEFGDNISVSSKRKSIVIDEGNVRSFLCFFFIMFFILILFYYLFFFLWNFNLNK